MLAATTTITGTSSASEAQGADPQNSPVVIPETNTVVLESLEAVGTLINLALRNVKLEGALSPR